MSYRNLEVWQESRGLTIDVHDMTLHKLPKFEMFEEGSQIRRSMKSVKSNIVEGYGRRRYKYDFIKFLTYYRDVHDRLNILGGKLNRFIQSVDSNHHSVKEESTNYEVES